MIQNIEHHEARQEDLNKSNAKRIKSWSKQDRAKWKAAEKAVNILDKAGLSFYLFTNGFEDKSLEPLVSFQWNNLFKEDLYDKISGQVTKEGKEKIIKINDSIINSFFHTFTAYNSTIDKTSFETVFRGFINLVHGALYRYSKRREDSEKDKI
jgi:hypothetical protein